MKKIVTFLVLLLVMNINSVSALSFETKISPSKSVEPKTTITETVTVTGTDIWAVMMELHYDDTKLELLELEAMNDFVLTNGTNIILDDEKGHSGSTKILTLTFKLKEGFQRGESTIVSLTNIKGASSNALLESSNAEATITVNATEQKYEKGDVNQDGFVRMNDVILALRASLNLEALEGSQLQLADMNNDGQIRMNDVIMILRKTLNLE